MLPGMPSSITFEGQVRKTYAFGSVFLTTLLSGCSIALIALVLQWNSFTTEDGTVIRFPVEGLNNLKVKRTASLLWSCVLVLPLCFTGFFLLCFLKKFMVLLMILMGMLGFASSLYASTNFREIYHKIHIILDDGDSFDDRCNSQSYNDVEYCVCNIGPLNPPANATIKLLKFRVDECDELEDVTGKFYIFFILSLITSLLSAVILFMSMIEFCIPVKKMSAVLLQNESGQDYSSTKQDEHTMDRNTHTVGFNNPVFMQCNKTGQRQSVFWYPYSSDPSASINHDPVQNRSDQSASHNNVTFSSFRAGKHERMVGAWLRH